MEKFVHLVAANTPGNIRVVSVFGSDSDIISSVKQFESILQRTRSFSTSDAFISPTPSPAVSRIGSPTPSRIRSCSTSDAFRPITPSPVVSRVASPVPSTSAKMNKGLFQFVKKIGASIKSRVVKVKELALGKRYGKTCPCKHRNCMTCQMISNEESFKYNNVTVRTAVSTCSSYNIVYLVVCSICQKHYVGRSCRPLRTRIGEHRRHFYQIVDKKSFDMESDDYALGSHLHLDHNISEKTDFNKIYKICILEVCSPKVLEIKEHKYIHKLNSLSPSGINLSNPLAIPHLYKT